jgi:Undecaprenyl-phosphate galactose phosphotransferase WbaP
MATATKAIPQLSTLSEKHARPTLSALLIVAADVAALVLAATSSIWLMRLIFSEDQPASYWSLWPVLGIFISAYALFGLYPGVVTSPVQELRRATEATTGVFLMLGALMFIFETRETYSPQVVILAWLLAMLLVPLTRSLIRHQLGQKPWWGYPVLVFGGREQGRAVVRTLQQQPELGLKPAAVLDDGMAGEENIGGIPVVHGWECAPTIARQFHISRAIVAVPGIRQESLLELIDSHASDFSHLMIMPHVRGAGSLGAEVRDFCQELTLEVRKDLVLRGPRLTKRVIDIVLALALAIVTLPLVLLIIFLIKRESPGPALYSHTRIGRGQRKIRVWKFRSMVMDGGKILDQYLSENPDAAEEWKENQKLRNDPRVTRIGRFLRRTSLDELPQIWNVLKGEMSMVGPRPIVQSEVDRYGECFSLYTQVSPGLTGLWQVSGRNDTTYAERVGLDAYYVRNWSVWLDFYLLARTATVVIEGRGAY